MLNREKIQFNYQPSHWPRKVLLGMALLALLAILFTPLAFLHRLLLSLVLLVLLLWQWRKLQSTTVLQILCVEQRWYVKLHGKEQRILFVVQNYSRLFVLGLVLILYTVLLYSPC